MGFDLRERPTHLSSERTRALAIAGVQGISGGRPPHISIRGNAFTLVDAAGNEQPVDQRYVDIIVLNVNPHASKMYYPEAYNADNKNPPACWSDNGIAPSIEVSEPQHATCAGCQWNAWGSAISPQGEKVKACRDYKKIAVFTQLNKGIQFMLGIPPNSLKGWKAYCQNIGAQGCDLYEVVTRVAFDAKVLGTLTFEPVGWVPTNFMPWYEKLMESGKTDHLIGINDKPIEGTLIAKPSAAKQQTLPPPIGSQGAGRGPQMPAQRSEQGAQSPVQRAEQAEVMPPSQPPSKPRGRPAKAQQTAVQGNGEDAGPELPDFLRRTSPGMQEAAQPDAEMAQAIDDAFSME